MKFIKLIRRRIHFLPFLLPGILGVAVFYIAPFFIGTALSFRQGAGFGVANYQAVWQSKAFRLAVQNTLSLIGVGVPAMLIYGGFLAVGYQACLRKGMPGCRGLFLMHLLPMVLPSAVIVFFVQMFLPFSEAPQVFWLLTGIFIWKNAPYVFLALFAGLRNIAEEIYDAARVDGAGTRKMLRFITVPLLVPYIGIGVVLAVLGVFRIFRESYLLFGNYPDKSIYLLQNYMNNLFYSLNYGELAAASNYFLSGLTVLFLLLLLMFGKGRKNGKKV